MIYLRVLLAEFVQNEGRRQRAEMLRGFEVLMSAKDRTDPQLFPTWIYFFVSTDRGCDNSEENENGVIVREAFATCLSLPFPLLCLFVIFYIAFGSLVCSFASCLLVVPTDIERSQERA